MANGGRGATDVTDEHGRLSRRTLVQTAAAAGVVLAVPGGALADTARPHAKRAGPRGPAERLFGELDEKIQRAMEKHRVPGAAVGVIYRGSEHRKGFGVTNIDYPVPVDADTVFRIASTTKTFTGTTAMVLVDQGKLDLDAKVRRYLPGFRTFDPRVAAQVTVRELLNHTPGFAGDDFENTGQGADALRRYVAGMVRLPQLTPVGRVFSYNNAALSLAGRVIEAANRSSYEDAVRKLLLDPLGLHHSRFFSDEIIGFNIAAPHVFADGGKLVVDPKAWPIERAGNANGGLISSVRDQLSYARFHLGDGRTPNGERVLNKRSLEAMRSRPGPGGTLIVELEGMGVSWMLRPSAQGVRIVQHGGDVPGQRSGFMLVPRHGFALTVLTNSDGGIKLLNELFADDWALKRFVGLTNLPARPQKLTRRELAGYEGRYTAPELDPNGELTESAVELRADGGQLRITDPESGKTRARLAFYKKDHVLKLDADGAEAGPRADFIRAPGGRVAWLRIGGRLHRHD
jgi:CubicO group peptidase (beta-lactamase class C family)